MPVTRPEPAQRRRCEHRSREGAAGGILRLSKASPDAARVHRHHGLTWLAAESAAHFGHVLDHTVYTKLNRRVRIGLNLKPDLLGTFAAAPALPISDKKVLNGRIA